MKLIVDDSLAPWQETALQKELALSELLNEFRPLLVAYSGGIDSTYLAWKAHELLGTQMVAVIADSLSLSHTELQSALHQAEEHHIPVEVVRIEADTFPSANEPNVTRCLENKNQLFSKMEEVRQRTGYKFLACGLNCEDLADFRSGLVAAKNHGILTPLSVAGLNEREICFLSERVGLLPEHPTDQKGPVRGLSLENIEDVETLHRVELCEDRLWTMGFRQYRIWDHGSLVRIQLAQSEMVMALNVETLHDFSTFCRSVGYNHVTLDCDGYRPLIAREPLYGQTDRLRYEAS